MEVFKDSKTVRNSEWIRHLILSATVTVAVALIIALISGCSVYQSNGRKSFESRAPDHLVDTNVGQSVEAPQSRATATTDTCWTQPLRDPLWEMQPNEELRVHAVNAELIEVCLAPEN